MKSPKYYRVFNYKRSLLPNDYLAFLEDGVGSIEMAKEKSGFSIGFPGWGLLYYLLLSHLVPDEENIIIETGTNLGCTTIILAQALKDTSSKGKIFTIEIDNDSYEIALNNIQKAGLDMYVHNILGDSKTELPILVNKLDAKIRLAFLDGSHLFNDVLFEFETIDPLLGEQSLVIFDNTYQIAEPHEDQRVNGAIKHIHQKYGGNLINLEYVSWFTPGLAIWQKVPFN